jgi:hypothetical protein
VTRNSETRSPRGRLEPAGTFVIQLRSDSDLPRRQLRGRVEHVVSGDSEPFTSLEGLVAFMARYTAAGAPADKEPEGS